MWVFHHRSDPFVTPFITVSVSRAACTSSVKLMFAQMKTSEGRHCNFGPYIHPSAFQTQLLAAQAQGKICGIYYDASQRIPSHITTFGVYGPRGYVDASQMGDPPAPLPCRYPHYIRGSPLGIFLSRASLSNIGEIKACSVGSRCVGMMITYSDGAQEVLGQWYESLASRQTTVCEMKDGKPFEKLYFKLSSENGATVLREVALLPLSDDLCSSGTVFKAVSYGVSSFPS